MTIQAVVLGAGGYVGGEFLRLLAGHPQMTLAAALSDSAAGDAIGSMFPHLASCYSDATFVARSEALDRIQPGNPVALFSAAPHGAAAASIAGLLDELTQRVPEVHVVDASADFRYARAKDWEAVYAMRHSAPQLIDQFRCALPEHRRLRSAEHIGHPGCFATATLLAAVPLLDAGVAEPDFFVAGITGSTGSGKQPQAGTHHPVRNANLYAYKPLSHRHAPEIEALAEDAAGSAVNVHFVPHSGPFARGILITLQARSRETMSQSQLAKIYDSAYGDAPFVHRVDTPPRIKDVVASNHAHIAVNANDRSVVVMVAIDNLVKGAAGGSMQWMNRLFGLPETTGLLQAAPGWT